MGYEAVGWFFAVVAGILVLVLPRKWAAAPLLGMSLAMPPTLEFLIYGLHFPVTRVLILCGWLRLILRSKSSLARLTAIDKVVMSWVAIEVVSFTLLWQTGGAFLNRMGFAIDTLGIYLLVRSLVRNAEDIKRIIRIFGVVSIVVAAAMLVEKLTAHNPFATFGGVPLITQVRLGRLRCQGPFLHPITAGLFGAMLLPLVVFLLHSKQDRRLGFFSVLATGTIVVTSASSGPLFAYVAGIAGLCLWAVRRKMRMLRWGIAMMFLALQILMKAPVWALLGRVGVVPGSDAYHRQVLIDMFVQHFSDWWLLGTKTTADWAAWFMEPQDITNQYLRIAADGGLLALTLFVTVIVLCFQCTGRTRRIFESREPMTAKLAWVMGVSLFVNVVAFMGCSYWDQVRVAFYAILALISALSFLRISALHISKAALPRILQKESPQPVEDLRLVFRRL